MHPTEIPKQYVDRIIARRGRLHLFEEIDPARTALLVLDMQNVFLVPGYAPTEIPGLEGIVPNINRLARLCRDAGAMVVWTQHTASDAWRSWSRNLAAPATRKRIIELTAEGTFGFEIHESLEVDASDLRLTKTRHSAFANSSGLHEKLQAAGRDTLIVTGTLSNVCCEATTRDAMQRNYNSIFVSDANGTRSDEEHMATLINLALYFADVMTTDEVARLLEARDPGRST
ncbi:cysteine hydrolase [Nitratireductor sp. XY-223]|uniref:isochorismatase family protein n=1 Tax=Nitratireductor sp. XY-223 TaxID=2561926 RepID=UPI0010AAE921|nr:cysteine hydrolase [Nitratireductor sp. XY-223]